jgi:hypothetical protein
VDHHRDHLADTDGDHKFSRGGESGQLDCFPQSVSLGGQCRWSYCIYQYTATGGD